jgi:hypothetical protein
VKEKDPKGINQMIDKGKINVPFIRNRMLVYLNSGLRRLPDFCRRIRTEGILVSRILGFYKIERLNKRKSENRKNKHKAGALVLKERKIFMGLI